MAVAVALAVSACGDDGAEPPAADRLADRLVAVLAADPGNVDGDVTDAEVTCPSIADPDPGDVATCVLRFDDGRDVEVDVEFQADGAIVVVAVLVR